MCLSREIIMITRRNYVYTPVIRVPVRFSAETKLKARAFFDAANSLHSFTSETIFRDTIG